MQDPEKRVNLVPGTGDDNMGPMAKMGPEGVTMSKKHRRDIDPSTIIVDLGWTAPKINLLELNDPLGGNMGQFCYYYV
jgi:hypothetical protein